MVRNPTVLINCQAYMESNKYRYWNIEYTRFTGRPNISDEFKKESSKLSLQNSYKVNLNSLPKERFSTALPGVDIEQLYQHRNQENRKQQIGHGQKSGKKTSA